MNNFIDFFAILGFIFVRLLDFTLRVFVVFMFCFLLIWNNCTFVVKVFWNVRITFLLLKIYFITKDYFLWIFSIFFILEIKTFDLQPVTFCHWRTLIFYLYFLPEYFLHKVIFILKEIRCLVIEYFLIGNST